MTARHQCRRIPLIWHPAQAASDRETVVFDQAIAGHAPVPSASVTAYSEATPASGNEVLIALWLDGGTEAHFRNLSVTRE